MASSFDLVIRGGTVVDGTGGEPYRADVAVSDDRVVGIGTVDGRGAKEIDAEGLVVTPGFIEGHTHMDAQVLWDPLGSCSCWHGVTTVVMGNCGFTLAPGRADQRDLIIRNIERSEDISRAALEHGIDWKWDTFPDYLDVLDGLPKGINYVAQVGHSALRTWAMGERAFEEEANEDDLRLMEDQLRASLRAGAAGFTSTQSAAHQTVDGGPVASRLASWGEIERLVSVLAAERRGMVQMPGPALAAGPDAYRKWLDDLRELMCSKGVPAIVPMTPMRDRYQPVMECVEAAARQGGTMFGNTHGRGLLQVTSFRTKLAFDRLPEWAAVRSFPLHEQARIFRDPERRRQLVAAAADEGAYPKISLGGLRPPNFERLSVYDSPIPPYRSVAEMARERNVHPVELMIELGLASDFSQLFIQPMYAIEEDEVLEPMRHPLAVIAESDSGAHVLEILDSSVPTHILAYWVREREEFTLQDAVRMLTSRPAGVWGLTDRGVLAEGAIADLNVFDPATVAPSMPVVDDDLPTGAKRLKQGAVGFRANVVAGAVVHENGEHTGELPGRLLRGPFAPPRI